MTHAVEHRTVDERVGATAAGYRRAMRRFAGMRNLDLRYARVEAETLGQHSRPI